MIKEIVLITAMGTMGLLWGSGDVTIQVINAVKEQSITPEFDKKLAKSGLDVHKIVEGGRYIVTLGTYKDTKSAQTALKKARGIVTKDAFIRLVNRDQMAATPKTGDAVAAHETAKSSTEAVAVHNTANAINAVNAVSVAHETVKQPVVAHTDAKEVAVATVPKEERVVVVEVKPVVVEVKNTSVPAPIVVASSSSEKREAYRNEIAEAINYYKNSPYHRFEPVKLQQ